LKVAVVFASLSICRLQAYVPVAVAFTFPVLQVVVPTTGRVPLIFTAICASCSKLVGLVTTLTVNVWYAPAAMPLLGSAVGPAFIVRVTEVTPAGGGGAGAKTWGTLTVDENWNSASVENTSRSVNRIRFILGHLKHC
jgi:hypothetical protein